ncbi:hypothetical protein AB4114_18175 [Paenibacillus sp. 2RAB27]|uniref:hypothetical protein n=1 Tax=Paenibacillus sp. 2RAB27 TaxID=3232991 RepID=UPI003F9AE9A3
MTARPMNLPGLIEGKATSEELKITGFYVATFAVKPTLRRLTGKNTAKFEHLR